MMQKCCSIIKMLRDVRGGGKTKKKSRRRATKAQCNQISHDGVAKPPEATTSSLAFASASASAISVKIIQRWQWEELFPLQRPHHRVQCHKRFRVSHFLPFSIGCGVWISKKWKVSTGMEKRQVSQHTHTHPHTCSWSTDSMWQICKIYKNSSSDELGIACALMRWNWILE